MSIVWASDLNDSQASMPYNQGTSYLANRAVKEEGPRYSGDMTDRFLLVNAMIQDSRTPVYACFVSTS